MDCYLLDTSVTPYGAAILQLQPIEPGQDACVKCGTPFRTAVALPGRWLLIFDLRTCWHDF